MVLSGWPQTCQSPRPRRLHELTVSNSNRPLLFFQHGDIDMVTEMLSDKANPEHGFPELSWVGYKQQVLLMHSILNCFLRTEMGSLTSLLMLDGKIFLLLKIAIQDHVPGQKYNIGLAYYLNWIIMIFNGLMTSVLFLTLWIWGTAGLLCKMP